MRKNILKNNGFTLVEMMVAIAVFSIVMVTAMSALLNVIDANNKARSIKTSVNNLNFALEAISKDVRAGANYSCSIDGSSFVSGNNCQNGGVMIKTRTPRAGQDSTSGEYKFVYYKFADSQIWECLEENPTTCSNNGGFTAITSKEVIIKKMFFYVLNVDEAGKQPRIIITVSGEAGSKDKIKSTFDLQTSISQRNRLDK